MAGFFGSEGRVGEAEVGFLVEACGCGGDGEGEYNGVLVAEVVGDGADEDLRYDGVELEAAVFGILCA